MSGPPRNATVLDTTVLSNFAHVDRVELLLDLPRVATVDAVQRELDDGTETHPYLRNALTALETEIPVLRPSDGAAELEGSLLETLDSGEAQALAVADVGGGVLVADDGDARRTAKRREVDVTGSIGLLVRFVADGRLSAGDADTYLKRWIDEAGFRSPSRDFTAFLDELAVLRR